MKPTVTQLLEILNKPALLKWANKIGLEGISLDEQREKAFSNGTNIHSEIENFILYKKPFSDDSMHKKFDKLFSKKEVVDIEQKIETEYFYGRYDIRFKNEDSEIVLADFKTSKGVWFETILQLVAYDMSVKADRLAVIKVPEFKIRYINLLDKEKYQEILKSLSKIYTVKNSIIKINPYYDETKYY